MLAVARSPSLRSSRLAPPALALALALGGCKGSSSSSPGGNASSAEVRWSDAGADFALGDKTLALPPGELAAAARPTVMQDEGGKRLAYVNAAGDMRVVYVIGAHAYLGPTAATSMKGPVDLRRAPELDAALGTIFANAGARRAELVADVAKDKGEPGVVRLLIEGANVRAPEWDEAFAKLPAARAAEVRAGLAALLERGKPTAGLSRAVVLVPLDDAARAPALAARVRELVSPVREPRASAVMLRALASLDKGEGAKLGCEVLGHKPLDTVNAKGAPEEIDRPGREALVEAALVAVAAGTVACPHVAAELGEDLCLPYFRCTEAGPLSGRETSKQDEALCTREQLAKATLQELARPPAEVVAITAGTRPQLFALAALAATDKIPAAVEAAHARRRFALVQPSAPSCESGVAPGTACHCDEATVRDQTCRQPVSSSVHIGTCKFEVDEKQKKLLNVVAALPP
jgi:hypothetical protein